VPHKRPSFRFLATGVGSVPFKDIDTTCRSILEHIPAMPFWPQFVKRSHLEDMIIQYSEGLPLLEVREEKRALYIRDVPDTESQLVTFYDHILAQDIDYFSVSRTYAPGLYCLLEMINQGAGNGGPFVKGQITGPVTFAAAITDLDGKSVIHNPQLLDAMVRGLAAKALWQVRELEKSGRIPIIFLDEPYLSGFGSAFSPIQRDDVITSLRTVIDTVREKSQALVGIHCCGNTDWSMIIEAGPDIINFDAFEFMDYFLLYRDEIMGFLKGGGSIAWGIIPTSGFTGRETVEGLFEKIQAGFHRVTEWGIDPVMLKERSILTPACGMGSMTPEDAHSVMDLLSRLSRRCRALEE